MDDLTLYRIDAGLNELLEYRAERMADTENPTDAEEQSAIAGEIRKYLEQLPAKVDGVAAMLRRFAHHRQAIATEIRRLKSLDASIEAEDAGLKGYIAEILERQAMPKKGPRKLVGSVSELRLVGNGGLQPLAITDESLIPFECCWYVGRLTADQVRMLPAILQPIFKSEPSNSRIREAIEKDGGVPGAHLEPRGSRVEVK